MNNIDKRSLKKEKSCQMGFELLRTYLNNKIEFRARRERVKKRSIQVVCEHFEPFRNAAMGT